MNKTKQEENKQNISVEIISDEKNTSIEEINESETVPTMNVNVPQQPQDVAMLISDDEYLGVLREIMGNIREDRKQVSDYIDNIADMVINDGDATTSSKEALVNFVKIKTDLSDKLLKTADLMTRLKVKNTYAHSGPHLNAMQQNNFIEAPDMSRREIIRAINKAKKKD